MTNRSKGICSEVGLPKNVDKRNGIENCNNSPDVKNDGRKAPGNGAFVVDAADDQLGISFHN